MKPTAEIRNCLENLKKLTISGLADQMDTIFDRVLTQLQTDTALKSKLTTLPSIEGPSSSSCGTSSDDEASFLLVAGDGSQGAKVMMEPSVDGVTCESAEPSSTTSASNSSSSSDHVDSNSDNSEAPSSSGTGDGESNQLEEKSDLSSGDGGRGLSLPRSRDPDVPRQFKIIRLATNVVKCPLYWCDKSFAKRHDFVLHMEAEHESVSSLNCTDCSIVLFRPWDMFMHELLYHHEGLFHCTAEGCTYTGMYRSSVLAHYDTEHLSRPAKRHATRPAGYNNSFYSAPPPTAMAPYPFVEQTQVAPPSFNAFQGPPAPSSPSLFGIYDGGNHFSLIRSPFSRSPMMDAPLLLNPQEFSMMMLSGYFNGYSS